MQIVVPIDVIVVTGDVVTRDVIVVEI